MSIIKHVTLQKIVTHDFRYDPRLLYLDFMYSGCDYDTKIPQTIFCVSICVTYSFYCLSYSSLYGLQKMEVVQYLACGARI